MSTDTAVRGGEVSARSPWRLNRSSLGYIPAFDGIRAISVIAVLLFHGGVQWFDGGFLGVDSFFVLSGFLITSILLGEIGSSGRISFGRFYLGRARRLLPALVLVLIFAGFLALVFARDAASRTREDGVAALAYVTNWWNIFGDQSYFEAVGRPPMLRHLWSLAVEEQFYLIWPAVLLIAYRWRGRGGVRRVAVLGAVASTLLMALLSLIWDMPGGQDPSRLYLGSDTHAMSVLVGAAVATWWRPQRLPKQIPAGAQMALTLVGAASLAGVIWGFHMASEDSAWLFRGGFLLFAAATAVLIMVVSHPAVAAARVLGIRPLRYIGTRSYGLYLWHWPVFVVLRPDIDIAWTGAPALILRLAVTGVLAELSYRFVEMPIRRGALIRAWRAWRLRSPVVAMRRSALIAVGGTLGLFWLTTALWAIPAPSATDYLGGQAAVGAGELVTAAPATGGQATVAPSQPSQPPGVAAGQDLAEGPVTAIGDSVMLGARAELVEKLPKTTIDAAISRQAADVAARVKARKAAGQLADVVVIHTGTNGPAYASILEPMMKDLADRTRVVLVTDKMPGKWMDQSNSVIAGLARNYPNTRLADWASASAGRREYFYADGTHTTPVGARAYANLIAAALRAQ